MRWVGLNAACARVFDARSDVVMIVMGLDQHRARRSRLSGSTARRVRYRVGGSRRRIASPLRAGETIALVGGNGSGKTTLAKLLGQLYAPTTGQILWDGMDSATLDPAALRAHIGVIFQDFVRYQLSARENIAFGRTDRIDDEAAVHFAAQQAGADEFLQALPAGYERLGKQFRGGVDLSGGQWQRVALARTFFRDASLLVLAEPTRRWTHAPSISCSSTSAGSRRGVRWY
jgi:ABC-type multidrug transport system fused ATPase/permease subunit